MRTRSADTTLDQPPSFTAFPAGIPSEIIDSDFDHLSLLKIPSGGKRQTKEGRD